MSSQESEHSTLVVAWFVSELPGESVREAATAGLGVAVTPALVGRWKGEFKSRLLF